MLQEMQVKAGSLKVVLLVLRLVLLVLVLLLPVHVSARKPKPPACHVALLAARADG